MKLVIDADSAALFEEDRWIDLFAAGVGLKEKLQGKTVEAALVLDNSAALQILKHENIPCIELDPAKFAHMGVPPSRKGMIANIFGTLYHFPSNDCIVVDIGPAVEVAYIGKNGKYLGGLSYPAVKVEGKPKEALSEDLGEQATSGAYYGTLGAIERMVAEARLAAPSGESVMTVATGMRAEDEDFMRDLSEFIDRADPRLRLVGLREIMHL